MKICNFNGINLKLNERCYGFRTNFIADYTRNLLSYDKSGKIVYAAAGLGVVLEKKIGLSQEKWE